MNENQTTADLEAGLRAFDDLSRAIGKAVSRMDEIAERQEQIIRKQAEIWTAMGGKRKVGH
ncbi:hypothetical protein AA0472_1822 [Acetobacter estunensis NRIC 0472]|uniref:Uncharacterized protein n=1 Tax=Acetobacter estunensis TaxID=104097 RepID=A0A967EJI6_9PROT|nr:hypothetical protein [Acetobacter estunensis]NHO55224.1 hypothetical protein [Acetobacter estunensis]GBQ25630.1 hypothetical protein AA0472_1822 [Acetobacter estunensis NRIC 0472]